MRSWTPKENLQEKLVLHGEKHLSDAELLAIVLRNGTRNLNSVEFAHTLLVRFSGLAPLLDAEIQDLCKAHGLGISKATQLKAILELSRRYMQRGTRNGEVLVSAARARKYLMSRLKGYPHEVFACLFLDGRQRVIRFEELFSGTLDRTYVHPRELLRKTLSFNAASVILCHNHPSGVPEPSEADVILTEKLKNTLAQIDVEVIDHIIIGDGETVSFAERGML
ncbi:MAG: RadC family protein [Candidatus Eutrophobiaceae bacterium]